MPDYEWRRVRSRDTLAMLWGVFLVIFIVLGNDATPPRLAPCPTIDLHNIDWHFVASFFVVIFLAIVCVESLNWVGWLIMREQALAAESERPGGDLLIPSGWAGPGLAFGLLVASYVMRRPNLCEPFRFATMSLRDFVGILALVYGLLILTHPVHGVKPKGSPAKPE
jgi:hypothetical protein